MNNPNNLAKNGIVIAITSCLIFSGCQSTSEEGNTGAGLGAIVGGALGSLAAKDSKYRHLWTLAGAVLGASVGKKIEQHLNNKEKAQMRLATLDTLNSEKKTNWTSETNNISGSAYVKSSEEVKQKTEIPVLKSRIKELPPLDMVGGTFTAQTNSNLRGGPSTDYEKVGSLNEGETVTVVGKVTGREWYLISQGGVGTGFIHESLVNHTPEKFEPEDNFVENQQDNVSAVAVQAKTLCREVVQEVVLDSGKTVQDTVKACKGANGWEIIA